MTVETRWDTAVREALTALHGTGGAWVRLADLRDKLSRHGTSRAAQDKQLTRMAHHKIIHLDHGGTPTADDTAAALIWDGFACHRVTLDAPALTRREAIFRRAVGELERSPGDWVPLVDLRPILTSQGMDREAQDHMIKKLCRAQKCHAIPESNRKALQAPDHAAAIRIGGEDNHLLCLVRD